MTKPDPEQDALDLQEARERLQRIANLRQRLMTIQEELRAARAKVRDLVRREKEAGWNLAFAETGNLPSPTKR